MHFRHIRQCWVSTQMRTKVQVHWKTIAHLFIFFVTSFNSSNQNSQKFKIALVDFPVEFSFSWWSPNLSHFKVNWFLDDFTEVLFLGGDFQWETNDFDASFFESLKDPWTFTKLPQIEKKRPTLIFHSLPKIHESESPKNSCSCLDFTLQTSTFPKKKNKTRLVNFALSKKLSQKKFSVKKIGIYFVSFS